MKKIKSLIFTILTCGGVLTGLYFIPIEKGKNVKKESKFPIINEEEDLLGTSEEVIEKVEVPVILPIETSQPKEENAKEANIIEEPKKEELPTEAKDSNKNEGAEESKKEEKNKNNPVEKVREEQKQTPENDLVENKKEEPKKVEATPKESRIGVDRKLISGIPGTMNYKGKFPTHNVKEKGSITIFYTVDANGNVISAYRIDGIRSNNAINNAIYLIRKYVKAEKGKGNSTGTYTINFK